MVETEEETQCNVRGSLGDFVCLMESKLKIVDDRHPDGWGGDTVLTLFTRADVRMDRLFAAIEGAESIEAVGGYAVDVANWMMMVADNVGYLTDMHGK